MLMKIVIAIIAILLISTILPAQNSGGMGSKSGTKEVTYHGFLVDAMCAKGISSKPDAMAKAAEHTKSCALEESCQSSGYGIFSDGIYHKFDVKGDEKALSLVNKSSKTKGLAIEVSGIQEGDVFTLSSIKEAKSKMSMKKSGKKSS
jgi:hypothetical protein